MQSKACLINADCRKHLRKIPDDFVGLTVTSSTYTDQFASQFCDDNGAINWEKLTVFISGKVN